MDTDVETMAAGAAQPIRSDSKTWRMASEMVRPLPGSRLIKRPGLLRDLLRNPTLRQSGAEAAPVNQEDPDKGSIFFLDGEAHAKRRSAVLRFFMPKTVDTRLVPVMRQTTDALMAEFQSKGQVKLEDIGLRLVVRVASEIIGLTNSSQEGLAKRIRAQAKTLIMATRGGIWKPIASVLAALNAMQIFFMDVRPAIAARRIERKEDLISYLLDERRGNMEILAECLTFGFAGMTTTREFIIVSAWHLFDREDLRQRFLDGTAADQLAILLEILRLEPVASMIYRSTTEEITGITPEPIPVGTRLSLWIREANLDEEEVGANPHTLDPDRAKKFNIAGTYMCFGEGKHRCPGWMVALTETRIFLDKLFRLPGLRLVRAPDLDWCSPTLESYELNNAIIACDRA